ncbi:alanyl-tRNA editing protein [Paenibacillus polymyxa]|uniref:alanyl-tRNA editing protein n=1 Tax=Paenibacillus polymyxa TaxID=1406 RepID=UPI0008D16F8F|nr:DHHA1 domain-containing protein [Paenibacillus polymyxa]SEK02124.1 alanyl-tRNA synthetase [Paenibacillus polymyxa]
MATKLYYTAPNLTEWDTHITQSMERDEAFFVMLKETAFYPHGGGQPCDTGTIQGIRVLDVVLEDGDIWHQVERLPEEEKVACQLDWERRFDHMQQHSGQHLLSAICLELLGARTESFHLGQEYATIDVNCSDITSAQLSAIEQEANQQIYNNCSIKSYFVTHEQLKDIPLVKMPKVTENIRIVEIEGIEYNACGGTHVAQTGEIGMIKCLKWEKQKGMARIHFKCGARALQDFNESARILDVLSAKFNTGRKDILTRFEKWEQEHKQLKAQVELLQEENALYQAKELLSAVQGHVLAHVFEQKSIQEMQQLAAKLTTEHDLLVLFATTAENKIILAHNGTQSVSCGAFLKENLGAFQGKGGGSKQSAQAAFSSRENLLNFFETAQRQFIQG